MLFRPGSRESRAGLGQWPAEPGRAPHGRCAQAATQGKPHTPPLPPFFPTFSKENQSFSRAFGKYRYSSKAGTAQQIAWAKSPCYYFDIDRGVTGGWKQPCRPSALSLNIGRFPQAKCELLINIFNCISQPVGGFLCFGFIGV